MIRLLAFDGYRSLCGLTLELGRLTVITGGNGTGKSNIYRALRLLVDAAEGNLGRALAREGGMHSALFAGGREPAKKPKKSEGVRLSIGFADDTIAYELRLGRPSREPGSTRFMWDPEVKEETIRTLQKPRINLLERRNLSAMLRDEEGRPVTFGATIDRFESILSQLTEPHRYPALSMLRERLRRWRFYHQFRTDFESPMRAAQVGSYTPVLAHDGSDLAAAMQTILEIGDVRALTQAIADAFDGASLEIGGDDARFELGLQMPGLSRTLTAAELSDGTLRYLALLAALHSPRPPELLVLNEPETSLHPSVLAPLAKQIVAAATRSQIIVVSHAAPLVDAIGKARDAKRIDLVKADGKTNVAGRATLETPAWKWTT